MDSTRKLLDVIEEMLRANLDAIRALGENAENGVLELY
jgi:hypothetical protein